MMTATTAEELGERFWSKVRFTPSCWLWESAITANGYGVYRLNKKTKLVHRLVMSAESTDIDHAFSQYGCPRNCLNPSHLRPVTRKQNMENVGAYRNSQTGVRGVIKHKPSGKFMVRVTHNYKEYYGGLYSELDKAEQAAIDLRSKLFTHTKEKK